MNEQLLRIEEVALLVGTSTQTINNWYRWKRLHPDHELAKLLPDYIQENPRQMRYWKRVTSGHLPNSRILFRTVAMVFSERLHRSSIKKPKRTRRKVSNE